MYQHIFVAADGSAHSFRAAQQAALLASRSPGCKITLFHVTNKRDSRRVMLQNERITALQQERFDKLGPHEALLNQARIPYKVILQEGDPALSIIEYINTQFVDLMVIGSRGLNPLQQFVLGSVSHKVMKRASCPVIIVK